MHDGLKQIVYRGGVVRFRIPDTWVDEYEANGGGLFYADRRESGTLRLNLLTFEGPTLPGPEDLLRVHEGRPGSAELLPTGNALLSYRRTSEEAGAKLVIFYWNVANAVRPKHIRLALFSYALVENRVSDPAVAAELTLLDQEIRNVEFADELGELAT